MVLKKRMPLSLVFYFKEPVSGKIGYYQFMLKKLFQINSLKNQFFAECLQEGFSENFTQFFTFIWPEMSARKV